MFARREVLAYRSELHLDKVETVKRRSYRKAVADETKQGRMTMFMVYVYGGKNGSLITSQELLSREGAEAFANAACITYGAGTFADVFNDKVKVYHAYFV